MSQLAIEYEKLIIRGTKSVIAQDSMEKLSYEMFLSSYRFSKEYNYEEYPLSTKREAYIHLWRHR